MRELLETNNSSSAEGTASRPSPNGPHNQSGYLTDTSSATWQYNGGGGGPGSSSFSPHSLISVNGAHHHQQQQNGGGLLKVVSTSSTSRCSSSSLHRHNGHTHPQQMKVGPEEEEKSTCTTQNKFGKQAHTYMEGAHNKRTTRQAKGRLKHQHRSIGI